MVGLVVTLTFTAVFLLALGMFFWGESYLQAPMRRLQKRFAASSDETAVIHILRDDTVSSLPGLRRFLSRAAFTRHLGKYLAQADISQRVGTVMGMILLLALLGGWFVRSLTTSWSWSVLGAVAFGSLPILYIGRRRRIRLGQYAKQLPDALDALSRSLQVGHSLIQGIQTVAREMPEPAAKEFRITFEELRLGRSLREALQTHADRVESLDFNLFATALVIQREAGGNLTEILEAASQTVRERYKLLGQVQALSAQSRLGGKIVGVLPFVMATIVYLLKPDLIMVLFQDEFGKKLVVTAIVMQIFGFFTMKRITTIKI